MKINKKRQKIWFFLVALEKYLKNNKLSRIDCTDLYMFLKVWDSDNLANSTWGVKDEIKLPILCNLLNWQIVASSNKTKEWRFYNRTPHKSNSKKESYIKRICYNIDWIEVNDVDYESIFNKNLLYWICGLNKKIELKREDWLLTRSVKKLIVPSSFYSDNDLIFFKN